MLKSTAFFAAAAAATLATTVKGTSYNPHGPGPDFDLYQMCGVDIDAPNVGPPELPMGLSVCLSSLVYIPQNEAVTWTTNPNESWHVRATFKYTKFKSVPSFPDTNVDSAFKIAGSGNPAVVWSNIYEHVDMPGNDLTSSKRPSFDGCKADCAANFKCYAVTWTDYEGGTCWLKKRGSAYYIKVGAKSGYIARMVKSLTAYPLGCPDKV